LPEGNPEERPEGDQHEEFRPPNGGLKAWLLVLAGFFVFVNTWYASCPISLVSLSLFLALAPSQPAHELFICRQLRIQIRGITSTYGAFQAYYKRDLLSSESSSAISWVGSIQAFLVVFIGVIVGPLFDRGYLRALVSSGCFLTVFGMMMTSLATSYWQVFLAQGICVGLGEGMSYVPVLAVIATHFTTKRPIAIGLASLGSVVGASFPVSFFSAINTPYGM